jgi:hypothetical protein
MEKEGGPFVFQGYFFTYDGHNSFVFDRKEDSLWLNFFDLVDGFKIDKIQYPI